jgi:glycosyltransferase involved in cell wall biosynthesis
MRILYIVQHFSGPSGTSGSRPYENARRLVAMGHDVTLMCGSFDRGGQEDIEHARQAGIDVRVAPVTYKQGLSFLQRIKVFRQYMLWATRFGKSLPRPDVVFASSTPLTVGEIGRRLATHHHCPFVFEVRDLWPEIPMAVGALKNPVMRWSAHRMARKVYAAADHVIALSPGMRDGVVAWGVPEQNVTVIPNCSDTTLFGSRDQREERRSRYGWNGKFVCIHSGSMGIVNGLDYLLDAAKVLDERRVDDILIAIVGDGQMKPHLVERVGLEGIKSAVIYEPTPKCEMPALLSAADVGAVSFLPLPYMDTNSANKFFDFLAAGLPVVINYGGWQKAVLTEWNAGLSVDPSDPSTLADALIALRDDEERRGQMGAAARQLAEDRFDRDKLVSCLEAVLSDAAGCKTPAREACMEAPLAAGRR